MPDIASTSLGKLASNDNTVISGHLINGAKLNRWVISERW